MRERLQWHVAHSLERGAGCSVVLLHPRSAVRPGRAAAVAAPVAEAARHLRALLRREDAIEVEEATRIGIVLPGSDAAGARAVHERLCRALAAAAASLAQSGTRVRDFTLAFAHAAVTPGGGGGLDAVVAELLQADCGADLHLTVPLVRPAPTRGPGKSRAGAPAARGSRAGGTSADGLAPLPLPAEDEIGEEPRRRAEALGVPYIRLPGHAPAAQRVLELELACDLLAVPIGRKRGVLTVAMADPGDREAIGRLASATGLSIFPVLAAEAELRLALDQWAGGIRPTGARRSGR